MKKVFAPEELIDGECLRFQKYDVKIEVRSKSPRALKAVCRRLGRVFPKGIEPLTTERAEYLFVIEERRRADRIVSRELWLNGERLCKEKKREIFFDFLESRLRLTVAEFASEKVFLHAGVIGWKGRALIIPGKSFAGKTTLVAELVKRGAEYLSDEYAVLDAEGNVEPFPKWLSLRGIVNEWRQSDRSIESLGGTAAERPLAPGMILLAEYRKGARNPTFRQPRQLKQGAAMMALLPHTLTMRNNPKFVLEVLNKLTNRAIIVRTLRGEAAEFAPTLLGYFELQIEKE